VRTELARSIGCAAYGLGARRLARTGHGAGVASALGDCSACCGGRASGPGSTASIGLIGRKGSRRASSAPAAEPRGPRADLVGGAAECAMVARLVSGQFANGRRFWILNIVDDVTKSVWG
jgi:hypothetical protein